MTTKKTEPEQLNASAKQAAPLAVQYDDLNSGESCKRLPVMAWQTASVQMAWFRLKYPEGRVAISVAPG